MLFTMQRYTMRLFKRDFRHTHPTHSLPRCPTTYPLADCPCSQNAVRPAGVAEGFLVLRPAGVAVGLLVLSTFC